MMDEIISRQAAIDALWKALYEYEDKTEKQFQESEYLDAGDWIGHRIFAQNMNDIDRQTILNLPAIEPKRGMWINGNYRQICSECRYKGYRSWKFCPNCGAKMEMD